MESTVTVPDDVFCSEMEREEEASSLSVKFSELENAEKSEAGEEVGAAAP